MQKKKKKKYVDMFENVFSLVDIRKKIVIYILFKINPEIYSIQILIYIKIYIKID